MNSITVFYNYTKDKINRRVRRYFHRKTGILPSDFLLAALKKESANAVFVHAGLSKIKAISGVKNPYEYLLDALKSNYKIVFAPGFTPSFRTSGIYHKKYSLPEYGMWSRIFLKDSEHRTNDAIHSILYIGNYDFSDCNHYDSFGESSCFFKLVKTNVLVADIGTEDFVCTFVHVLERINSVPYVKTVQVKGIEYFSDTEYSPIVQENYAPLRKYAWNRKKIVKALKQAGILRDYSKNGFVLYFFRAGDLFEFLNEKIKKDIFWLIK